MTIDSPVYQFSYNTGFDANGSPKKPMPKKYSALKSQVTIRNENWKNVMKDR